MKIELYLVVDDDGNYAVGDDEGAALDKYADDGARIDVNN